ncbi:uncharacterized protein LOC143234554 isoform X2 [Tachypleus tridentatus]|uniref:uncharacterized protein LOC143234554 isoform X2 n=1 Tax=Tachypleus tridentatus TaxID=6853 RepID=UPI003FCF4E96
MSEGSCKKYPRSKIPVLVTSRSSRENVRKSLVSEGFKETNSNTCARGQSRKPIAQAGGRRNKEKIRETNQKPKVKVPEQSRENHKSLVERQKEQLQGFTFETDEKAFQTMKHGGLTAPRTLYKSPATPNQRKATPRKTPSPFCGRPSVYKTYKPVYRNFEDIKSAVVLRPDVDLPTYKQTPEKAVLVFPSSLNNNSSSRNGSVNQVQRNISPKESSQSPCSSDCYVKENPTITNCSDQKYSGEYEKENVPLHQCHVLSKPFAKTNKNIIASKTPRLNTNPTKLQGNTSKLFSSNHEPFQPSDILRETRGLPRNLLGHCTLSFPVVTPKPVKKNLYFTEETTASPELRERLSIVNSLLLGAPIHTPLVLRDIARRDEEVSEPYTYTATPHGHVTCLSNCRDCLSAQQCQPPSTCTPLSQHGSSLKQITASEQRAWVPLENHHYKNNLHCSKEVGTPPSEAYLIEKLDQLTVQKIRNVLSPAEKCGRFSPVCQSYRPVSKKPPLSLRKIVTQRNFDEAVTDKECALYSCDHGLTSPCMLVNHQENRSVGNPVAKVLAEGDEMHFVPVSPNVCVS